MKLKILRSSHAELCMELRDCDLALVNALRRVILADVPYVALAQDGFHFRKNTCVLHNHFLAHRLTLAPLHLSRPEADAYIPGSLKVTLRVANDADAGAAAAAGPRDVTTADLAVTLHDQPHPDGARLYPPDPVSGDHPLLTVLKPGEAVDVTGTAVKGTAAEHAAFAVASTVAFRPVVDAAAVAAARAKVAADDAAALNRFEHIDSKRLWTPGPDGNPRDFVFDVVSECGMSALDVVQSALDVLARKCGAQAGAVRPGRIAEVEVPGEGATLGNLLQSTAVDELLGGPSLKFVGYVCPHPLEKRVVFRMVTPDGVDPAAAYDAMRAAALARVKELAHLVAEEAARAALDQDGG